MGPIFCKASSSSMRWVKVSWSWCSFGWKVVPTEYSTPEWGERCFRVEVGGGMVLCVLLCVLCMLCVVCTMSVVYVMCSVCYVCCGV